MGCTERRDNEQIHHIFCDFPGQMCAGIEYFCVILLRSSEHRLIETTPRYA